MKTVRANFLSRLHRTWVWWTRTKKRKLNRFSVQFQARRTVSGLEAPNIEVVVIREPCHPLQLFSKNIHDFLRFLPILFSKITFKWSWLGFDHNSLFPAHQSQTKYFRKTFRQMFLWPHQLQKTNDKKSNLCCMKNVIVRQTLTWKQCVPTFFQDYTVREYGGHGPRKGSSIDSQCNFRLGGQCPVLRHRILFFVTDEARGTSGETSF